MIDPDALQDEILNGPLAAQLAEAVATGADGDIETALNAPTVPAYGVVGKADFAIWAASTDMFGTIEDLANDKASPLRSSAIALRYVLQGASDGIDFGKPPNDSMLDAWVAAGALSAENRDSLLALAATHTSRAQQLFGRPVHHLDIAEALRGPL